METVHALTLTRSVGIACRAIGADVPMNRDLAMQISGAFIAQSASADERALGPLYPGPRKPDGVQTDQGQTFGVHLDTFPPLMYVGAISICGGDSQR
jgi:hypothetical protein